MERDMNRKADMNEINHNHELPEDLRSLDADLARLGGMDRGSAPEGLEARLLDAVGGAMAPAPITITSVTVSTGSRVRWIGMAAAVLLVGSVGVLTAVTSGLFSVAGPSAPNLADGGQTGGGMISAVAFSEDVDLLLELVGSDFGSDFGLGDTDDGLSYGAQVDSVSLEMLDLDSRLRPAWDSIDSWVDMYAEGAI